MELSGKSIEINSKEYISPNGYPKFAFWYDEESQKYSIANTETGEATDPFVDELIYSELPLETWTADYVVVRIGNFYYLSDNNGTCYFESVKPFVVCRNVFVTGDYTSVITKEMQKKSISDLDYKINVEGYGGYLFAFAYYGEVRKIISALGEINDKYIMLDARNIHEWYFTARGLDSYILEYYVFLDKDFKSVDYFSTNLPLELIGRKSKTYKVHTGSFFSTYVSYGVFLYQYGDLEIILCKNKRKTYFFMPNKEVEEFNGYISTPKVLSNYIVYRQDDEVITRSFNGEVIAKEKLSPKELYDFILSEELLAKPHR